MRVVNIALIEWPRGIEAGCPRLLGRTGDPQLVEQVRLQLKAERERDVARLDVPIPMDPPERADHELLP